VGVRIGAADLAKHRKEKPTRKAGDSVNKSLAEAKEEEARAVKEETGVQRRRRHRSRREHLWEKHLPTLVLK